jgi:hypothetical protein
MTFEIEVSFTRSIRKVKNASISLSIISVKEQYAGLKCIQNDLSNLKRI